MTFTTPKKPTPTIDEDIILVRKKYGGTKAIPVADAINRVVDYAERKRLEEKENESK